MNDIDVVEKGVVYETPSVIEVGDFGDVTRIRRLGNTLDSPWAWWCPFC